MEYEDSVKKKQTENLKLKSKSSSKVQEASSDSDSSTGPSIKKFKKNYKQNFKAEWLKEFKWLKNVKPENKQDLSFCKLCNKSLQGGYAHLKRHEINEVHKKNEKAQQSTPSIQKSDFLINKNKELINKESELKMIAFIAEHNLAISLMDYLPKLIKNMSKL